MKIYHILDTDALKQFKASGIYKPQSLAAEGFIHCSQEKQVLSTANRRYANQHNLIVLVIDTDKVDAKIVIEDTSGRGEKHPHIYGSLHWNAVIEVRSIKAEQDGSFKRFPSEIIRT